MRTTVEEYEKIAAAAAPKTDVTGTCVRAFCCGGGVCVLGQALSDFYRHTGFAADTSESSMLVSITLVITAAVLTAAGLFHKIASFAGAGVLVPVTGFANSVAACAVEYKTEGYILGVGAKIFTIAGPVIVYGVAASALYGALYYLAMAFGIV
jgi:stage V sporulation protein AC